MKQKRKLMTFVIISSFFLATYLFSQFYSPTSSSSSSTSPLVMLQATAAEIDSNIPKKLYPCLPKKVKKLSLAASTSAVHDTYYLIEVYQAPQPLSITEAPPPAYEQTLVKLDNLGCLIVVPKEKMGAVSLIEYVPESVARALSLQMYKEAITQVGGKEKFQQLWDKDEEEVGNKAYLFPENVWALQQLGIKIPSRVQVVTDVEQLKFE